MAEDITIATLVQNGTLNAKIAGVLWAAVADRISFLTVAIPRFAGKTTLSNAVLALRPLSVPLHRLKGEDDLPRLKLKPGGYLVVPEFSPVGRPDYIWGEPVRRVFDFVQAAGYSLQGSLHAGSPQEAMGIMTKANGLSDKQLSLIKLVLYIEVFETSDGLLLRRLAEVYEVYKVVNGKPVGQTLFRWHKDKNHFERAAFPKQWGRDKNDLQKRSTIIADLAKSGRTNSSDIAKVVETF